MKIGDTEEQARALLGEPYQRWQRTLPDDLHKRWQNCYLYSYSPGDTNYWQRHVCFDAEHRVNEKDSDFYFDETTKAMTEQERRQIIEDELLLVASGGEMPEVALAASIFHVEEEDDGPHMLLTATERAELVLAARGCYENIIRRDLDPENRDTSRFRGLKRALVNWQRYQKFCGKNALPTAAFQKEAAQSLAAYLARECRELSQGLRQSSINCPARDLQTLAGLLGLAVSPEWLTLCCPEE